MLSHAACSHGSCREFHDFSTSVFLVVCCSCGVLFLSCLFVILFFVVVRLVFFVVGLDVWLCAQKLRKVLKKANLSTDGLVNKHKLLAATTEWYIHLEPSTVSKSCVAWVKLMRGVLRSCCR